MRKSFWKYLAYVKVGADDPMSEKSQAFQEFVRLLTHAKGNHCQNVSGR